MGLLDIFGGGGGGSDALEKAIAEIKKVRVPTIEEQKYQIDQLVQQGVITPEEAQTILAQPSAMENVVVDPRYKQAQLTALEQLQNIGSEGGITPEERAQIAQVQEELGTSQRGEREAISQTAAEQGRAGGGLELAQKLAASQGATMSAAKSATDIAAQARERALQAIQGAGTLGGQMGEQQFSQEAQRAAAMDAINKFNAANKQNVELTNVGARNTAQGTNLAEKQRVSDINTASENTKRASDAALIQANYQNELNKASAVSSGYKAIAEDEAAKKAREQAFLGSLIGAGGQIGAGAMMKSDARFKKNVEDADFDVNGFMASIKPKKFEYKNPADGVGEHYGVMAQDLEKTPVGKSMVVDTPDGKVIDGGKAIGVILAELANLSKLVHGGN